MKISLQKLVWGILSFSLLSLIGYSFYSSILAFLSDAQYRPDGYGVISLITVLVLGVLALSFVLDLLIQRGRYLWERNPEIRIPFTKVKDKIPRAETK